MDANIKCIIDGETYSRNAISTKLRNELSKYQIDYILNNEELSFFLDALSYSPKAARKRVTEVIAVEIRLGPTGIHNCYWLIYSDGTEDDFGVGTMWKEDYSIRDKALYACSGAIEYQKQAVKKAYLGSGTVGRCQATGVFEDVKVGSFHVDHKSPNTFNVIFNMWFDEWKDVLEEIHFIKQDGFAKFKFADNEEAQGLQTDWQHFHLELAELQVTTSKYNVTAGARDRTQLDNKVGKARNKAYELKGHLNE